MSRFGWHAVRVDSTRGEQPRVAAQITYQTFGISTRTMVTSAWRARMMHGRMPRSLVLRHSLADRYLRREVPELDYTQRCYVQAEEEGAGEL